jgi:hypothetical protein
MFEMLFGMNHFEISSRPYRHADFHTRKQQRIKDRQKKADREMMGQQRVIVCGGRDYSDRDAVFNILDALRMAVPNVRLIHGGARVKRGAFGPAGNVRCLWHGKFYCLIFP